MTHLKCHSHGSQAGWRTLAGSGKRGKTSSNSSIKALIKRIHRYCVIKITGKIIEGGRNLVEVWLLLQAIQKAKS
jgi:hypothetical protein